MRILLMPDGHRLIYYLSGYSQPTTPLCVRETKGGDIILAECRKFTDGRSNWELQANG